jgi:uncharacterized protein (DUF4415 family)
MNFVKKIRDAEEAKIQAAIASDPDAPEATDAELAQARPFAEAFPELAASMRKARGRPALDDPKQQVTLRLDAEVIRRLRATGKGWQARANDALRKAVGL